MPGIQLHASMADSVLSNRFIRRRHRASASRRSSSSRRRRAARGLRCRSAAAFAGHARWPSAAGLASRCSAFRERPLAADGAAARWRWRSRSSPAPPTATSSKIAKSAKSRGCSADTSRRTSTRSCSSIPELAQLGGRRRDMTVLFSDIRGFTRDHRKGQARGARRAAERVLHADGRDRVPPSRHRRQVRRRHGDGAVRRARRRR